MPRSDDITAPAPPRNPHLNRSTVELSAFDALSSDDRYVPEFELGRGGMGVVRACRDEHLGRSVAMKVLDEQLTPDDAALASFMREVRIQAQLEHPAIVPLYEMGRVGGAPYLTMKQVRGTTLADALANAEAYGLRRLLAAFSTVCLAVEYAHTRGIIHRDLKPANVMLGDFGEVYVLDWGISKVVAAAGAPRDESPIALPESALGLTRRGSIAGTPGYMAPEQERGDVDAIDAQTDVFALGVMLRAILEAHARDDGSSLEELRAIACKASARAKEERIASARALSEAVEAYLSGEQDAERRRAMSREHAEAAAALAHDEQRAMREIGRALALDPDNRDALETFVRLMSVPPKDVPPEVSAELERAVDESIVGLMPLSTKAYASLLLLAPLVLWMGIRDWVASTILTVTLLATVLSSFLLRRRRAFGPQRLYPMLVTSSLAMTVATTMFGPFVFVPTLASVNTLFFAMQLGERKLRSTIAIGCAPMVLVGAVQTAGIVPPSYRFSEEAMSIHAWLHGLGSPATPFFLWTASIGMIVLSATVAIGYRDRLRDVERRARIQAWRLSQLVPAEAPAPRAAATT